MLKFTFMWNSCARNISLKSGTVNLLLTISKTILLYLFFKEFYRVTPVMPLLEERGIISPTNTPAT